MWVLIGQTSIINRLRTGREKMIVYGAYSTQNQFIYVEEVQEETSEITASIFLSLRILYPYRRLDIILDNARWYYGLDVQHIAHRYTLHLHYLPSYSSDLNAIEPLWEWGWQETTYNYEYPSFKKKKETILNFFQKVQTKTDELKRRLIPFFHI